MGALPSLLCGGCQRPSGLSYKAAYGEESSYVDMAQVP